MSILTQTYYDILRSIRRGSYRGEVINAKPLLVLSVIALIENGIIKNNKIYYTKDLEIVFKKMAQTWDCRVTPLFKPFYYLTYDGFWHLRWKTDIYNEQHPSPKFLRENIEYAFLDNALWDLLQDEESRNYFRKCIEDYYLN